MLTAEFMVILFVALMAWVVGMIIVLLTVK